MYIQAMGISNQALIRVYDDDMKMNNFEIKNCVLDGNDATGVYAFHGSANMRGTFKITGTTFTGFKGDELLHNHGGDSGDLNYFPAVSFDTVTFSNNEVISSAGRVSFRGALDSPITTVTIEGNTFHDYVSTTSGNKIYSAVLVTQAAELVFNGNEVDSVPAWSSPGNLGNGHALQALSLSAWTFNAEHNHIHDNAGGFLIVTQFGGIESAGG